MTSRRAFLAGGVTIAAGTAGLAAIGRLDDALRAVGVDPTPLPDPVEKSLIERVRNDQARLLAGASNAPADVRDALSEHLEAVGGGNVDVHGDPFADLTGELAAAAAQRRKDALEASSADLARVLASMAGGLAVLAEVTT